ncbi:MAG: M48 family metallopeptidase, partial [Clostridia bacterium]|nr:M48 family metallopeptidase [Clostridia bacterium]
DLRVIVRAPHWVSKATISRFIEEKADWIEQKTALMKNLACDQAREPKFTADEMEEIKRLAKEQISSRVAHFAEVIGADYAKITLRFQRTLWGSCTSGGNLSFNCLLALCPKQVLDYVVFHELCHRKHQNHSPKFWAEVEKYMPTYKASRTWLRENGRKLIGKIPHKT